MLGELAGAGRRSRLAEGGAKGWRAAQQRRRGRLSARGRATLAACAVAPALGVVVAALAPGGGSDARPLVVMAAELAAPDLARDAPPALIERLPSGPEVLKLHAGVPPGIDAGPVGEPGVAGRVFEQVPSPDPAIAGPLRLEYTFDAGLTREVFRALQQGRVDMGHVIVLEPSTGRILAYASTDPDTFPPTRVYPAASLVKVITAAAALDVHPDAASLPCRYTGDRYRLTPARLDPPHRGTTVSLRDALAMSNNQCFAQLAVHAVGSEGLMQAIGRFGWLDEPAPAHAPGHADPIGDRFDLGRMGCGLSGCQITPLHAAQLAAALAHGELVAPRWVDRVVDAEGRELPLPARPAPRRVMSLEIAEQLRDMLVETTVSGTAKRAFGGRRRPVLGDLRVAGKTGSISGTDPRGRYEWFIGVAPADNPRLAVAAVTVTGELWWWKSSQLAAEVLRRAFCDGRECRADLADRWLALPEATARAPQGAANAPSRKRASNSQG